MNICALGKTVRLEKLLQNDQKLVSQRRNFAELQKSNFFDQAY